MSLQMFIDFLMTERLEVCCSSQTSAGRHWRRYFPDVGLTYLLNTWQLVDAHANGVFDYANLSPRFLYSSPLLVSSMPFAESRRNASNRWGMLASESFLSQSNVLHQPFIVLVESYPHPVKQKEVYDEDFFLQDKKISLTFMVFEALT